MFERFTDRARKVMALAWQEAQRFNHPYIGTEHILLGLVKEDSSIGAAVLAMLNVDLGRVRSEVEKVIQPGPSVLTITKLPQTPGAKEVVRLAIKEAHGFQHEAVTSGHILMGLLGEEEGVAATVLVNLGVSLERAREGFLARLADQGFAEADTGGVRGQTDQGKTGVGHWSNWVTRVYQGFEQQIERLEMARNEAESRGNHEEALALAQKISQAGKSAGQIFHELHDLCRKAEKVLEDLRKP